MKKIVFILIFFLNISLVNALEISSENAILYNLTDDLVLYTKEEEEQIPIASLTKIMTAVVALENISNLQEVITIPPEALQGLWAKNAMVAGFKAHEKVTYEDLLYGALLPSGADATTSLAYLLAGNEAEFVKKMNQKAKELGLVNTNFTDTSGLDDLGNYSTVHDIATLLRYALQNETFKKIFTSDEYLSSNGLKFTSTRKFYTTKYQIEADYIYGSKTGYTTIAGFCLASIAHYDGIEYLLVTAGAPTTNKYPYHFVDAKNIYDYFINNYQHITLYEENDPLYTLTTVYSKEENYPITAPHTMIKYLPKDTSLTALNYVYNGEQKIYPWTKKGQIGTLDVYLKDTFLTQIPVYFNGNLTLSISKIIAAYKYLILSISLILLIFLLFIIKKLHHRSKRV